MSEFYYYKSIYKFSKIWPGVYSFIFLGGLVIRLYHDFWRISNLVYFFIGVVLFILIAFCIPIYDMLKLVFRFNFDIRHNRWVKLNEHLQIIGSYYKQDIKKTGSYKTCFFISCQITALIFLDRIDEGLELYEKVILDYGEYFTPKDELKFYDLYIRMQIDKGNIDEMEETISRTKSLVENLENEKIKKCIIKHCLITNLS
jgi:hypothetical protein